MFSLIKNELIKLNLRKKLIICSIILFAIGALMIGGSALVNKLNNTENTIKILEKNVEMQKEELNKEGKSEKEKADIQRSITQIEMNIQELKNEKLIKEGDWKTPLEQTVKSQEEQLNSLPNDAKNEKEMIRTSLITNKYYLEHNIKPSMGMDLSGFSFLDGFISTIGGILLAIIAAIMAGDVVSGEYTPPTMKVLLTKPVSRIKVLLSKYFAAIIGTVSVVLIVEFLIFLIGGIIYGFGSAAAPRAMGTVYENYNNLVTGQKEIVPVFNSTFLVPAIAYIGWELLFQILFIVAALSFSFMLSTLLKTSTISTTLSFIIPIVFTILNVIPYVKKAAPFLYMSYGNPSTVASGRIAQGVGYTFVTPGVALLMLLLWIGITLAISLVNFKKKDLLI